MVAANRRPATYALYEMTTRIYLKPALGTAPLARLSASRVQTFLNGQLAAGQSIRQVQVMRTVLSSALTRAMREELLMRNVARLAELPAWERQAVVPWTAAEARGFLTAAHGDPLYPAFVLLLLYGLRRGEVLGLRWADVDLDGGEIRIRQQSRLRQPGRPATRIRSAGCCRLPGKVQFPQAVTLGCGIGQRG